MTVLSRDVFLKQDSTTTNAIIQYYDRMSSSSSPSSSSHSPSMWRVRHPSSPSLQKLSPEERMEQSNTFQRLAFYESEATLSRDDEDAIKLQRGIDLAVSKHVLPSLGDATSAMNTTSSDDDNYNASDEDDSNMVNQQQYINIDVMGKTPDEVAMELWKRVSSTAAKSTNVVRRKVDSNTTPGGTGQVIVLVGLSGTGKGTTFTKLGEVLRNKHHDREHQVVSWSNGNIFRSVTLLATRWCEKEGMEVFDPDKALTKENLEAFMKMLEFGKFNGKYDTRINGLGIDNLVSDIQNTLLKQPSVAKNIPTVAEVTQGEIILFAKSALEIMKAGGITVLLEGREQTLNYIPTKHKFRLVMSDETLIGKRRAAQRLMAAVVHDIKKASGAEEFDVVRSLKENLETMAMEVENY